MAHFTYDCPHCGTTSAGFTSKFQWQDRANSNRGHVLSICGVCNRGVVMYVLAASWSSFPDLVQGQYEIGSNTFPVLQAWPADLRIVPPAVPEAIGRFYEQGVKSLQAGNWDAAGSMFRKTLDVATKQLRPDLKDKNLFARINEMVTSHDLTPAMGDWSHRIRLDGNSAVHDEEPETEADAVSTRDFTEAFLTYAFTLPARVAAHTKAPANDSSVAA